MQNLRDMLGNDNNKDEVEALMKWADLDGDGKITYKEFLTAFRSKTQIRATQLAHMESSSEGDHEGDQDSLVGLDAKIPGGKDDPDLSPSLKPQAEVSC